MDAAHGRDDIELAGVIGHARSVARPRAETNLKVAGHLRELGSVDAALVCVPADRTLGVAREILQQRVPIVECAILGEQALKTHYDALAVSARHHHVAAVVGAGWDPGALALIRRLFNVLIPRGSTDTDAHPGLDLHRSALDSIPGIAGALACERRGMDGRTLHYVYVKLRPGASAADVKRGIAADPLYAGDETLVFPVDDLASLETAGSGIVLHRLGIAGVGAHQSLLLEARFEPAIFAARVMLDGACRLRQLSPGAHPYVLGP